MSRRDLIGPVAERLRRVVGEEALVTDLSELRTYECDGLSHLRVVPALVVLARSSRDVQAVVATCAAFGVPFVARGSGTGLSGGALPRADGVLVVTSRMRDDPRRRRRQPARGCSSRA